MSRAPVRYYFSFTSTFSALADWRIDSILDAQDAELVPLPLVLPRLPAPSGPLVRFHEFKISYLMDDAARWAERIGMPWNPPEAARVQRWPGQGFVDGTDATVGWYFASDRGCERAYRREVFRKVWCEGEDIASTAILVTCAVNVGLHEDKFRAALDDPDYRRRVPAVRESCIRDRVFGVPTFVVGTERFWGNDRLDFLVGALRS